MADASRRSLHITRPTLPAWLQSLDVLGMSVGDARVDLSFHRHEGRTSCRVLSKTGDLNVLVRN
ncbi:MAG: hypothetical protein WD627_10300 [Actinomycetota bacterium]